jgi:hypothetical protein
MLLLDKPLTHMRIRRPIPDLATQTVSVELQVGYIDGAGDFVSVMNWPKPVALRNEQDSLLTHNETVTLSGGTGSLAYSAVEGSVKLSDGSDLPADYTVDGQTISGPDGDISLQYQYIVTGVARFDNLATKMTSGNSLYDEIGAAVWAELVDAGEFEGTII